MKPAHRPNPTFIIKPLTVSCFVAMMAGCISTNTLNTPNNTTHTPPTPSPITLKITNVQQITTEATTTLSTINTQQQTLSQQANQANSAAQAKSQAEQLKQSVQGALTKANQAVADAQTALKQAQSANNQELIAKAQTALTNAQTAQNQAQQLNTVLMGIINHADRTLVMAQIKYVAPIDKGQAVKTYPRQPHDSPQPTGHANTITGYGNMDEPNGNGSKLTEAFYGVSQSQYAEKLEHLKKTINTTQLSVGVIDSGINPDNPDLVGANYHDKNLVACYESKADCGGYNTFKEVGFDEFKPVDNELNKKASHGSQMAVIIAGNRGMTNAKIYSYTDGTKGHALYDGNADNFVAMQELNKRTNGKVKIFNNSWGYLSDDPTANTWLNNAKYFTKNNDTANSEHSEVQAIHDLILNKDALLIHSTGNEGRDNVYNEKLAPQLNADFKKGFLTVSSLREDYKEANLCGDSAEWCLVAPSSSLSHDNAGKLDSYAGTSPATARVTGTALLVKGAYPWMKNEHIVQTLLSTAQDFDDIQERNPTYRGYGLSTMEEVRRVGGRIQNGQAYVLRDLTWLPRTVANNIGGKNITKESGWGLLDTVAATQGYGGFYWQNVVLDTTGTAVSVFDNNIKGKYGFTKAGTGKLVLTGDNTYQGDTIITGGTLEINGKTTNSKILVNGGELTGYGTVHAITQNAGSVNNEGNLMVAGDYQMGENATFKAKFGNIMTVNGTASINGELDLYDEVTVQEPLITATGSKSTVLRAGTLTGKFKNYKSSNRLFTIINVEYTGKVKPDGSVSDGNTTDVVVSAKRNSVSSLGSTLDSAVGRQVVEKNMDKVLTELDAKVENQTLSSKEQAFAINFANKISHASTPDSTLDSTRYTQTLFEYDPAFYANQTLHAIDQSAEQSTLFAKQMMQNQQGLWAQSNQQDHKLSLNGSTSERTSSNQSVGISTTLKNFGIGLQFDVGTLGLDDSNGSTHGVNSKTAGFTAGVSSALSKHTQATAWAKNTFLYNDAKRGGQASHRYDGVLYAGGVHLGSKHTINPSLHIKPYLGMGYYRYTHDGSMVNDGIHLVKGMSATRLQGTIGVDTAYQISPLWHINAGLKYDTAFKQDSTVDTQYVGTNTPLGFEAWQTGKDKFSATLGAGYQITPQNQLSMAYDHHQSEHSDGNRIKLTLHSQF